MSRDDAAAPNVITRSFGNGLIKLTAYGSSGRVSVEVTSANAAQMRTAK